MIANAKLLSKSKGTSYLKMPLQIMKLVGYKIPKTLYNKDTTKNTCREEVEIFASKLEKSFLAIYDDQCKQNKKLMLYNKIRGVYRMQPYLSKIKENGYRIAATKCRISSHNMPVETGRYTKTEVNQRLCQMCNLSEVGDEKHYLVRCTQSAITEERGEMLTLVHRISPQFSQLSENTRMVYLMSFIDENIMRPVAKFLNSLLRHM